MPFFTVISLVAAVLTGLVAGAATLASARWRARQADGASRLRAAGRRAALVGGPVATPSLGPAARGRPTVVQLDDLVGGLLVLGSLTVLTMAFSAAALGVRSGGFLRVAFQTVAVSLPVMAAWVVVAVVRRPSDAPTAASAAALALALLCAPVGAYATYVEPDRLDLHIVQGPDLPAARDGGRALRVGVISDIQFSWVGPHEEAAVALLMSQRPDLIVIPGDVFHGEQDEYDAQLPAIRELLSRLRAPGGVFLVQGDTDGGAVHDMASGTGVQVLVNQSTTTVAAGRRVTVAGVERDWWSPAAALTSRALAEAPGEHDVRLLVAHRPDIVGVVPPNGRVDLVLAGHTHGGQVSVPFFGPPITQTGVPRHVAAGGLHPVGGNDLYLSTGVGVDRGEAPRIRFGSVPSVDVVELGGR